MAERSLWGPEFEFYLFDGVSYENGMNVVSYRVESAEADWRSHELGSGYTIPRHGGYHAIPPQDHLFRARNAIFSVGNRSAAVRIPKYANQPGSARFEFRTPDATGNPYLALAAQLQAGIDGVRRGSDPTALGFGPVDDDVFSWPPERRATVRALPTSLDEALSALERDRAFLLAGGVFGDEIVERWVARKRAEEREVCDRPHPYEIELYYDL